MLTTIFPAGGLFGVIGAALSAFVLGGLWYGPIFGSMWQSASEVSKERLAAANPGVVYGLSLLLTLLSAAVLSAFIGAEADMGFGAFAGFSVGAFWVGGSLGVLYLFEQRRFKLWAVNTGYWIVPFTLMGVLLTAF